MIEHGNWLIEFCNDWKQLFERCNWYTFRLCLIEVENDKIMGGIEATIILIGLGFRWRWNRTMTEARADLIQKVKEIEEEWGQT